MDRKAKRVLSAVAVTAFVIGTDFTGAMLLVTPIEQQYSVDITTTQWVLNAYALTFSMCLVSGGRLGDMFGHRRYVLLGLAVFGIASLGCVLAPNVTFLIFARALQGIGSAFTWPCLLALAATCVEEEERGAAVGVLLGAVASGNALAPFIAGTLAEIGDWRGFFVFNVVFSAVCIGLMYKLVARETGHDRSEAIDYFGMGALALAVFCLLFGLDVGADYGWTGWITLALFGAALALFVSFPIIERSVIDPMIPVQMMRNGQFVATLALNGFPAIVLFLCLLYFAQYMQKVFGWSIFWSSIGILPLAATGAVVNLYAGRFYNTVGPRRLLAAGHAILIVSCGFMLFMKPSWGYAGLIPVMILVSFGGGLCFGPSGTAAVNAAGAKNAGLAGGLSFMFHLGMGAIGIACATALMFSSAIGEVASVLSSANISLPTDDLRILAAGTPDDPAIKAILARFSGSEADTVIHAVRQSFSAGIQAAFWFGLAIAATGFLVSLFLDESKLQSSEPSGS